MSGENLQPWDRQPGETRQAYQAFRAYLNTPAHERSLQRVASELSKSRQILDRWRRRWHWEDRASAWDRLQARQELDAELRAREEQRQHTLKIGKALRRKGVEAINFIDPADLSVSQVLSLLIEGEKMIDRATSDTDELRQRREMEYASDEETTRDRTEEIEEAARVYQNLIDQGILLPPTDN